MKNDMTCPGSVLERLPTERLRDMLREELQKQTPDADTVRRIMRILQEREEAENVEISPAVEAAWEEYLANSPRAEAKSGRGWLPRAAAVAVVLIVVHLAVPQGAKAGHFYEMLTRWTDSVLEFFDPDDTETNALNYEFQTDHPGLRQVYDTIAALGVTEPVVPMWLPEGYELTECKTTSTTRKTGVVANFANGSDIIVLKYDVFHNEVAHTYHKDETKGTIFEKRGIVHDIVRNNDFWTVVWARGNLECSLSVNCQEDTLYRILDSIYTTEGN